MFHRKSASFDQSGECENILWHCALNSIFIKNWNCVKFP